MIVLYGLGQNELEPLAAASTSNSTRISSRFLTAGALAGPVYLVVGLAQAFTRPGFSWHGLLHFASGGIGFLGLIAATMVFARRYAALGQRGWAAYSVMTGLLFLLGFVGIASGSGNRWTVLGFWIAVVIAWAWLTAMTTRLKSELSEK